MREHHRAVETAQRRARIRDPTTRTAAVHLERSPDDRDRDDEARRRIEDEPGIRRRNTFPSSHVSPFNRPTTWFPQRSVEVQSAEQPSPDTVLPSSHCSSNGKSGEGRSTKLFPHAAFKHTAPSTSPQQRRPVPQLSPALLPVQAARSSGSAHWFEPSRRGAHTVPAGHTSPSAQYVDCERTHPDVATATSRTALHRVIASMVSRLFDKRSE